MNVENILTTQRPFLKSSEVAKLFNVDHSTIFLWVKKRKLHPIRTPGGNFRFTRGEVDRLFREVQGKESEKRVGHRYSVFFPIVLELNNGLSSVSFEAIIQDISLKGLGLIIQDKNQTLSKIGIETPREAYVKTNGIGILKETVKGEIRYMHKINERQVSAGILIS